MKIKFKIIYENLKFLKFQTSIFQIPFTHNLKKETLSSEKSFPLRVFVCNKCLLVQLPETIDPNELFSDYAYFSSFSETWLKHAEDYVDMVISRFDIKHSSQIMEIASNDGYLLKNFVNRNISVLGIEPASNVADTAIKNGIPTLKKFFSEKTANLMQIVSIFLSPFEKKLYVLLCIFSIKWGVDKIGTFL